jgi:S-adenosylmethionine synthetase
LKKSIDLSMKNNFHFNTSESVSAGHPDKMCDQISDALLDLFLSQNPFAHVAVETLATTDRIILAGEIKGSFINPSIIDDVVRHTIKKIGYDKPGFHYETLTIENYLHEQSEDISRGVGNADSQDMGVGDQGSMIGYACNETEAFLPASIYYAHKLLRNLSIARDKEFKDQLGPDAKSQVTIKYTENMPISMESVVLSTQHHPDLMADDLHDIVLPIIKESIPQTWIKHLKKIYVNPTGRFVIGGPHGDTGLTGRKIVVDTYGCSVPHGGGSFSGKDPTKIDRSGAYMMRYLAKNIVAAGLCDRCTLQISYVIGRTSPLSLNIDTHHSENVSKEKILQFILTHFDLSLRGITTLLQLNRPIYQVTASYGHFGRTPLECGSFSWEKLDAVDIFKNLLNN